MNENRKCLNCGIPNNRGLYCPKCDCIIYVGFQFDDYVGEAQIRMLFLQSIEQAGVCSVATLRAEAVKRQKPMMQSLANRIDTLIRPFPHDIGAEIFRRALTRAKLKAESMAKNTQATTDERNEAYRAVAMAAAAVTEPGAKKPTAAEIAYDGFDHAGAEEMTEFFD